MKNKAFWESEQPELVYITSKNKIAYYSGANCLTVAYPDWQRSTGEMCVGKTVVVSLDALTDEPEKLEQLIAVLQHAHSQMQEAV